MSGALSRPLATAAALVAAHLLVACCALSVDRHEGSRSPHFDGERFHNPVDRPAKGFGDFLKWRTSREPGPWRPYQELEPGPPPPNRVARGALRVTFVNHSTVLVQMDGLNVLTDPIWSERSSPVAGVGPARVHPPGLRFDDLPPIDLVLLSHDHYDHLDLPTLRRLRTRDDPVILAGLGIGPYLERRGFDRVRELDWWKAVTTRQETRITFVPAQHFSGRGLCDRNRTLWGGFVLEGPAGVVYYAGDTGDGPHFEQIAARFGPPRLALLPIGAFVPRWFMAPVHIGPVEAVDAHLRMGAAVSVAVHHGTFPLGDDGQDQPADELKRALTARGVAADAFWVLRPGEGRDVPPAAAHTEPAAPTAAGAAQRREQWPQAARPEPGRSNSGSPAPR